MSGGIGKNELSANEMPDNQKRLCGCPAFSKVQKYIRFNIQCHTLEIGRIALNESAQAGAAPEHRRNVVREAATERRAKATIGAARQCQAEGGPVGECDGSSIRRHGMPARKTAGCANKAPSGTTPSISADPPLPDSGTGGSIDSGRDDSMTGGRGRCPRFAGTTTCSKAACPEPPDKSAAGPGKTASPQLRAAAGQPDMMTTIHSDTRTAALMTGW
jgi:hypothetical protein